LLILDEPVSALDVSIRAQILNLLRDLQDNFGLTYLLISHDIDVVAYMSSRVAVMYLGKIVERGSAAEVLNDPQHPYTKALLSSVLPAHPDQPKRRIKLRGLPPSPIDPPSGCVFRTRCPEAQPLCASQVPAPRRGSSGSVAACHFVGVKNEAA
jgi:oligopeptide/dipeptide ABC transporter ATP-binding protein